MRMTRTLAVLSALVLSAGVASADPITGGELYAVFAGDGTGTFSGGPGDTYIVTKFATFAPGSDFPGGLTVDSFPAAGDLFPGVVLPGSEYFMVGWASTGPDHLIVGAPAPGLFAPNPALGPLTTMAMGLGTLLGGDAAVTTSAAFWGAGGSGLADSGPGTYDIPVDEMSASMGGEDIFGFTVPVFGGVASFEAGPAFGGFSAYGPVSYLNSFGALSIPGGGGGTLPPPGAPVNPIPEPATLLLVAGAAAGAAWRRKRAA